MYNMVGKQLWVLSNQLVCVCPPYLAKNRTWEPEKKPLIHRISGIYRSQTLFGNAFHNAERCTLFEYCCKRHSIRIILL